MAAAPMQPPQNYHVECEAAVNMQIQLQLYTSYVYLSMACYCQRLDVALQHLARFFLRRSHQWQELAEKLMFMQNERGGSVVLRDIAQPNSDDWHGGAWAVECAFHLEDALRQSLMELHRLAASRSDPALCDFLARHYLRPLGPVLKGLGEYLTELRRAGPQREGLVSVLFSRLSLEDRDKED
ncbi:ferritin heavy chain-like [Cavia porcellus]|uniref:ferritin heavy chain-like n=1 Tax=Cavia porcellus TaxID=10141 RepID=UPI00022B7411